MKKNLLVNNFSFWQMTWRKGSAWDRRKQGMKREGRRGLKWRKTGNMGNVRILFLFFWEYMAHIFMKMDKMSDCRTFSLIQGVVIGLPGWDYWIYLCVFRSRGAHWAGEPPALSCFRISSSERLTDAAPRVPAGTPVSSERQPFIR